MRNRCMWFLSLSIIFSLLALSCTPPVSEEEQTATGEEEVTQIATQETQNTEKSESVGKVEEKTAEQTPETEQTQEPQREEPSPETQSETQSAPEPQPTEQPLPEPEPLPEEPPVPEHKYQELAEYVLDLINADRTENGLNPVVLAGNTAAQAHAEENLAYSYSSHWNIEGLKPYMRYTLAGGVNYVAENVIGTGLSEGQSETRDPKEVLAEAERQFMQSPSHKANILNKWHKKVNLGIAYNNDSFYLVQDFEGDYIGFSSVPEISGMTLSMAGKLKTGKFEQIAIRYDPLPEPLTPQQLREPPYDSLYNLGATVGNILAPLPPGYEYTNMSASDTIATTWDVRSEGWFRIEADISPMYGNGSGVYTVVVLATIEGELVPVTYYSIFIS